MPKGVIRTIFEIGWREVNVVRVGQGKGGDLSISLGKKLWLEKVHSEINIALTLFKNTLYNSKLKMKLRIE